MHAYLVRMPWIFQISYENVIAHLKIDTVFLKIEGNLGNLAML